MRIAKKTVAIALTAVMALGTICASAAWVPAGYDTRDLDNIGKIYNEVIDGNYTSNHKIEALPEESIEWKQEGYEFDYPHAGYDRLYLEGNRQVITRYNGLFPQWETRFADYFWELYGDHKIYQRQQTNIPGYGWKWDISTDEDVDDTLLVPTGRDAKVAVSYERYGVGPFGYDGFFIDEEEYVMYTRFGVEGHEYKYDYATKEIVDGTFFDADNLSQKNPYTGEFLVSDKEIASHAASIMTKVLDGPALRGDNGHKVLAEEYLKFNKPNWNWDADSLIYAGAEVSWTEPTYEINEPYNMYQYLIVNGLVFDGRGDLPRIFRYTGGKANPKVEWKYAFAERAYPYSVIEFKYVDGKLAINPVTGEPIYRVPTGVYANYHIVATPTELQLWLKDANEDAKVETVEIDHTPGYYYGYAPAGAIVFGE